MRKAFGMLCMLAMVMLLAACSGDGLKLKEAQITGIPFKNVDDEAWSMMSPDGKVIFSEKMEKKPHLAFDNRFFVREENELFSLYTCEETPVKVSSGYINVNHFIKGKALVSKPGGYIQIIDVNGKVVRTIDKVSGKEVEKAEMTDDGYLRFMTTDHCWGLLDPDGKVLFEPEYGMLWYKEGVVLTNPENEKLFAEVHVPEKMVDHICNLKGEETGTVIGSRYISTELLEGKYIKVYKAGENKDEKKYGLFNLKGEPVVKPSKQLRKIELFRNDEFVFYDGEKYGLMNIEGKVLLEPEYDRLWFFGEKLMLAGERDAEYNTIGTLIDKQGKKVSDKEFLMYSPIDFTKLGGKHALLSNIDEKYVLVNKDGSVVEGAPEFDDFSGWDCSDDYVYNQHVDVEAFANHLNISLKGCDGLSVYMTPEVFVNNKQDELTKWLYEKIDDKYSSFEPKDVYELLENRPINSPDYYGKDIRGDDNNVQYVTEYNGVKYSVTCYFFDGMVEGKDEDKFVDKPMSIELIYLSNSGKKNGYLRQFFNAFTSRIRPLAKVLVENDNFLCVTTPTEIVETYFSEKGDGIYIFFERIKKGQVASVEKITEKAKKRANIKEDCRVEISD